MDRYLKYTVLQAQFQESLYCHNIYVHDSVFQDAFMDVITTRRDIDRLEMRKVSYYEAKSSYPTLYVVNVCKVDLTDIKFQNNSSPLLEMIGINKTVFRGYCCINFNSGMSGILLRTTHFLLSPNTKFEMTFNSVKKRLLCIPFQFKERTLLLSGSMRLCIYKTTPLEVVELWK